MAKTTPRQRTMSVIQYHIIVAAEQPRVTQLEQYLQLVYALPKSADAKRIAQALKTVGASSEEAWGFIR